MPHRFIHQYDEEYDSVKKARRSGRPPSTKEDMLKLKIKALEAEYEKGFGTHLKKTSMPGKF